MASQDRNWKKNLANDLQLIDRNHTPEAFPAADAAKRSYDQHLDKTQSEYEKILDAKSEAESKQLNRTFRDKAEHALVREEQSQWPHITNENERLAARLSISNRLTALDGPNPPYRQNPEYQEQTHQLTKLQSQRLQGLRDNIQETRDQLNERYGFARERRQERSDRGDPYERDR